MASGVTRASGKAVKNPGVTLVSPLSPGGFSPVSFSPPPGVVGGGHPRATLPDSVGARGPARTAAEPDGELQRETAPDGRQEAPACLVRGKLG
ncbi:hypothetical protein HPB47_019674 [Ixodes persulcatus]|uniref:Uncharacterized protein n=1 Tax=Ixodes persulcatus TaxID=34615 RepID=A0AC60QHJ3_IXOPE|nr:hypothetical protein HPB47_019674 [Ixodes persulcatus]